MKRRLIFALSAVAAATYSLPAVTNSSLTAGAWQNAACWSQGYAPLAGETVIVSNNLLLAAATPDLESVSLQGATLTFTNWNAALRAVEVTISGNGIMTLPAPFTDAEMSNRVWIVCSNLTLNAGSAIDVSGKGYAGGSSSHQQGYGPGGGETGYGGGYGGRGGQKYEGYHWGGASYGVSNAPAAPGSGGGYGATRGGAGGGVVLLEADGKVSLFGTIAANGGSGSANKDASGAGGSIFIKCRQLGGSSTGLVSANGVNGKDTGGGGGGGRIAVIYDSDSQAEQPGVRFETGFGNGARSMGTGESGTLFLSGPKLFQAETLHQWLFKNVRLFVDNWQTWSPASLTVSNCSVTLANRGFALDVPGNTVISKDGHLGVSEHAIFSCGGSLVLTNGGALSVFAGATNGTAGSEGALVKVAGEMVVADTSRVYPWAHHRDGGAVRFAISNLTVLKGGAIDADQKGYAGADNASTTGYGPGGGILNVGAGHGGAGGREYNYNTARGAVYGTINGPLHPGSGGGGGVGGDGGGLIWIEASGNVLVNGTLTACGGGRVGDRGGGGSGGGISIACQRLEGSNDGLIAANGGFNADTGGPGGGGRIAIFTDPVAQGGIRPGIRLQTACGERKGRTSEAAQNGTTYFSHSTLFRADTLEKGVLRDTILYADNLNFTNWQAHALTVNDCQFTFGAAGFTLAVTNSLIITNGASLGIPALGELRCGSMNISTGSLVIQGGDTNATGAYYGSLVSVGGKITLRNGGWIYPLSHRDLGGSPLIRAGEMSISSNSGVNADAGGYRGGDADSVAGLGPGGGGVQVSFGAGGGYGGKGGKEIYGNNPGGAPYCTDSLPLLPGSGGGAKSGGFGGGLIQLEIADKVELAGKLSAAGGGVIGNNTRSGGGAGGGIFVMCRRFNGAPTAELNADGGNGGTDRAGGGGGGRIAIWQGAKPEQFAAIRNNARSATKIANSHLNFQGNKHATRGTANGENGVDGTVCFLSLPPPGSVIMVY